MNHNHYPDIDQEEEFSAFYLNDSKTNDNDNKILVQTDSQMDAESIQPDKTGKAGNNSK